MMINYGVRGLGMLAILLMPIIGFSETSGTLNLSLFDSDEGSFAYDANNGGVQNGNKHQLSYTRGGDQYHFIATDYGYPGATTSGNIWIVDSLNTGTSPVDDFTVVITTYALKKTHDIQLNGNQFSVVDASGKRVGMLPKVSLGTVNSRCIYTITEPEQSSSNDDVTFNFESCPITIRAISDDTGAVYQFTSAWDGIEFTPSDDDKNIESKLFDSSNVHIGFMTINVETGQFNFYDLNRVPF